MITALTYLIVFKIFVVIIGFFFHHKAEKTISGILFGIAAWILLPGIDELVTMPLILALQEKAVIIGLLFLVIAAGTYYAGLLKTALFFGVIGLLLTILSLLSAVSLPFAFGTYYIIGGLAAIGWLVSLSLT